MGGLGARSWNQAQVTAPAGWAWGSEGPRPTPVRCADSAQALLTALPRSPPWPEGGGPWARTRCSILDCNPRCQHPRVRDRRASRPLPAGGSGAVLRKSASSDPRPLSRSWQRPSGKSHRGHTGPPDPAAPRHLRESASRFWGVSRDPTADPPAPPHRSSPAHTHTAHTRGGQPFHGGGEIPPPEAGKQKQMRTVRAPPAPHLTLPLLRRAPWRGWG